ncbi:membrane-spanning 4-domains subfamily A member 12 isoform X1 [Dasypus novemcinctus]|uniref:membrane-spanning 4-domains subfamily A member 12 isoform X1 n=1 Tax=Dasypus novemcinctus TaxID=9361 RepID=UPI00265EECE5|nr:membrane-spanning 4-domains subfamily A member 12 isoform X1 [Dasypus novemcinctus]
MLSKPTTHSGNLETIPNPNLPSNSMAQQPVRITNPINQAQGTQPPFIATPGMVINGQQGQRDIQMRNSVLGIINTDFKEEAKIVGAIQIIIGLMHIGFGLVLSLTNSVYKPSLLFTSISFIGGYPFWGGVSFIISGSLSIMASKEFSSPSLTKGNLGMNILSAIFAFIGVILLLVDVSINGYPRQDYWSVLSGKGISGMLMIFSLLEFSITCTTAYFAHLENMNINRNVLFIPNRNMEPAP